jgi:hypothetical protein
MMRSSHGQLVVDSLRSLRAASSGITAVAEGAAGAGSGSKISYRDRRNCKSHDALIPGQLISKQRSLTGFLRQTNKEKSYKILELVLID